MGGTWLERLGAGWAAGSPRTAKERPGPWLWGGWGGDTGDSTKGLAGVVGVPGLGVPGLMGTSRASEPVGGDRVGTESGLRSGLLAASVTLSMAATCGFQNCGGAGYEAGRGCYLWSIWF